MTYRFLGSTAELGNGVVLDRFGETVDLTPDEAAHYALDCHVALLPKEEFQLAGFTAEELTKYHTTALHVDAPAEFLAKRAAVWRALYAHREGLAAASAAKEGKA